MRINNGLLRYGPIRAAPSITRLLVDRTFLRTVSFFVIGFCAASILMCWASLGLHTYFRKGLVEPTFESDACSGRKAGQLHMIPGGEGGGVICFV